MGNHLQELLEKLELQYEQCDIEKLKETIDYLNEKQLSDLCQRLLRSTKAPKFLETLTEVNFTAQLLNSFPFSKNLKALYEPKDTKRPIDLVIKLDEINYYIQIKSLSNSIRVNQKAQVMREIRKNIQRIPCKRGLIVHVSENFKKKHVSEMMEFIMDNLTKIDGEKNIFRGGDNITAEIIFCPVKKIFRDHLVLLSFGDLDVVEITGITQSQIKKALSNAAGAFEKNNSEQNINLIVLEIKNTNYGKDLADALYGTTYITYQNTSQNILKYRDGDGLYSQENFYKKIASVVMLYRESVGLIGQYKKIVYSNPFLDYKPIINLIHDRIIDARSGIDDDF